MIKIIDTKDYIMTSSIQAEIKMHEYRCECYKDQIKAAQEKIADATLDTLDTHISRLRYWLKEYEKERDIYDSLCSMLLS